MSHIGWRGIESALVEAFEAEGFHIDMMYSLECQGDKIATSGGECHAYDDGHEGCSGAAVNLTIIAKRIEGRWANLS